MILTTGNRVMKPIVEFTIAETRCRIVPAPVGEGGEHLLELHAGFGDPSDETQVIGTCAFPRQPTRQPFRKTAPAFCGIVGT